MSRAHARLGILVSHLAGGPISSDSKIKISPCAATCTIHYARPAAPDCFFAVAAQDPPSSATLEALAAANTSLTNNTLNPITASSTNSFQSPPYLDTPPLFARPTAEAAFLPSARPAEEAIDPEETPHINFRSSFAQNSSEPTNSLASSGHWAPQASIEESDFGYSLQAVLPGVKSKDIRAELLPGRLVISGVRHLNGGGMHRGPFPELLMALPEVFGPTLGWPEGAVGSTGKLLTAGRFRLEWKLPENANIESLRAEFKDGCLVVQVTKKSVLSLF